ncbi:MAG: serine phosphatase RsbU (regulator of sigma subunit) [Vicingaceae bacterium]|jgi:serine phosphatase RsbU (regulator of sigma subunit)
MTLASRYRKSEKDKLITEQNSIENLEHLNQFKNEQTETLKKEVKIRTQEVLTQNAQLASQNKRIIQSINYAQRLQTAIQTSNKLMQSFFDTFSIYFRPKDIVSSDFY